MSDNTTPWCCTGFAAFCPLCEDRTGVTVHCPGHTDTDTNRETVRVSDLHARFRHPDYEYRTTEGPRKQWDHADTPPVDDAGNPEPGWERNVDAGHLGWERFDYTEESYWRRRKPQPGRSADVACAVLHTDGEGNTIPCPGYPHPADQPTTAQPKPRASVVEIIATGAQPTEDGAGSIILPREVRINGVSVFTPRGTVVKIDDFQLGESLVTVHLSLVVRRLVIAADGDLNDEPQAGVPFMQAAKQHLGRPYDYNGPAPEEQP